MVADSLFIRAFVLIYRSFIWNYVMIFHGFVCELSTYKKKGVSMLKGNNKIGSLTILPIFFLWCLTSTFFKTIRKTSTYLTKNPVNPPSLPPLKIGMRLTVLPLQILQHHSKPVLIHRKEVRFHWSEEWHGVRTEADLI